MSDASTRRFNFFVTPLKDKLSVEEGNYVLVPHPLLGDSYLILAQVIQIKTYEEVVGSSLREKAVQTTAVGKILGYVESKSEKKCLKRLFSPPTPGSKVYLPYFAFLEDLFCRNPEGTPFKQALHIGKLESQTNSKKGPIKTLNFYLDSEEFTKQHYLISAMSGAGKTHTAKVIIEELANKTNLPVVIFDPNAEYLQIGLTKDSQKESTTKKKPKSDSYSFDFQISVYSNETKAVSQLYNKHKKETQICLKPLTTLWNKKIAKTKNNENLEELKKIGKSAKVTIIDTKKLNHDERQKLFTSCLKTLLKYRVEGIVKPFILFIEDVNTVDSETLEKLVAGSRKMGISMVLITQHLSEIKSSILSQMGTQIMGRTTDQQDLLCLANMALEKTRILPKLAKGEWIINGITMQGPTKVLIREQYST